MAHVSTAQKLLCCCHKASARHDNNTNLNTNLLIPRNSYIRVTPSYAPSLIRDALSKIECMMRWRRDTGAKYIR